MRTVQLKYHAIGLQIAAVIREVVTNGVRRLFKKRDKQKGKRDKGQGKRKGKEERANDACGN